nr:hypothetical protein [Tanacetum cinerariifolium]
TIMSDSEDSTVTYATVSSPYEGRSGDVSPGVDGPLVMPEDLYTYAVAAFQALPPRDYVPGPEEQEQAPPSPVYIPYVPEPVYPKSTQLRPTLFHLHLHSVSRLGYLLDPSRRHCPSLRRMLRDF